jgi:predicted alpha/beta hydrolase family esterase
MAKRVIIVHGWDGGPKGDWIPWIKQELEKRDFTVLAPQMPETARPKIEIWVPCLAEIVGNLREDDVFIGHSIGCQTILRFLERLPNFQKADKVILVAPWGVSLSNLDENEEEVIAKPWLETPIGFEKVKQHARSFTAIFSDNDPFVPLEENSQVFKEKLRVEIIVEKGKGHFLTSDGVSILPALLKIIESETP